MLSIKSPSQSMWHQMPMTVCKYELHFGVDISIFRVCPVEVSTGLCDIIQ